MISDIWTLEHVGGETKTLAEWGVQRPMFEALNQRPDTLVFHFPMAAADADALWAYRDELILRRSGSVFFRGRVALTPRMMKPDAEGMRYEVRNIWWDLEKILWTQGWNGGTGSGTVRQHPRAILGIDPLTGDRIDGRDALAPIADLATAMGSPLTIVSNGLAEGFSPITAEANQSLADMIRAELRWHPDATVVASYDESGTTLTMVRRATADAVSLPVGARPTESIDIVERHDMVCDAVHLQYEASILELYRIPATTEDPARIGSRRRTIFFSDKWPEDSERTTQTMFFALPGNAKDPDVPEIRPGEIQTHKQPIVTRPLPRPEEHDSTAVRWWYDKLGLAAYGLETDDVKLPSSTVGAIRAHNIQISPEYREERPSAVNPESTPLFSTTDINALPRELVEGQIADWMGNLAVPVIATSTVAVKASSVNALDADLREPLMKMVWDRTLISGTPYYLIDGHESVIGTDARTKVYETPVSVTAGVTVSDGSINAANINTIATAQARSVIPNLAKRIFDSYSVLHYQGTLPIMEQEAGGTRYLGRALNLTGSRSEWSTMRAQIQGESIDIETGTTTLTFGPPQHLAVQDFLSQRDAVTRYLDSQDRQKQTPADPIGGAAPGGSGSDSDHPVVAGSIGPRNDSRTLPPPMQRLWDVRIVSVSGSTVTVKLSCPGKARKSDDVNSSGLITIDQIGAEFTLANNDYLVLEYTKTGACTLKKLSTWTNFPFPYATTTDTGFSVWEKSHFPLWKCMKAASVTDFYLGRHVPAGPNLVLERLAPDADLEIADYMSEMPSGQMVGVRRFFPSYGGA